MACRPAGRTVMAAAEVGLEGGGSPTGLRPDAAMQRAELMPLLKTVLRPGESWYLIDSRWFKQWKKYVGFESWDLYNVGEPNLFPGPIDNSGLFTDSETQTLKEHLIDELDYVLVPTEAWDKLANWYGCMEGQKPIVRKVVEYGLFVKHCKVEVYLLELKLCQNSDPTNLVDSYFSKGDTIATIEKESRKQFNISDGTEVRLWNRCTNNTYEQLSKLDSTIQDAGLYQGQVVLIEVKNEDGSWPRQSSLINGSSFSYSYNNRESLQSQPGLCGLSNLGNTCFMNSALQCLSNTPPLTDYFLEDKYEAEINQDNPLGMRGEIAEAYAELIKQMWSGRNSHVAPRMFKTQVGRFAPQFSGYQQQDSQELLAFLLDGLHEDLNRVKKKPYLELKDANGRPDSVVAKEAWENHRLRNDSIIVDIFHGLFKSTLVCPKCSKISVTFDPFCYLTLPLPLKKDRSMEVFLMFADPQRKPMQFRIVVPMMGGVSDLCDALSKISGIPAENMVVTEVYNHRFQKFFQMDEGLTHIMPKDNIFVYEVCKPTEETAEWVTLSVYFREKKARQSSATPGTVLYGQPLLIAVPKHKLTVEYLYNVILERIGRYVKINLKEEYSGMGLDSDNCNGFTNTSEGNVEEMEHQDCEENKQKILDADAPQSEERNEQVEGKQPQKKQLFSFSFVNSYGTSEVNCLTTEGKILKLSSYATVAIDWDSDTRKLLFDEEEAQAFEKHNSMFQSQKKKTSVALRECIELFTTMETLGEHDPWYCPNCKKHQQATKKFDLWSLPRILVVHLKRFSYNRYWRDKLDTVVDFPIRDLNMSEFVCDPAAIPYIYDLIAVSNHYGGLGVGHYTAYAKNKINGKWYYFDDSNVSPASEEQIVTKAAYVLFYQRRDVKLKGSHSFCPSMEPEPEERDGMDTN
ncbi:ubiquitin carboxyl-terminal hydrolase 4 isoform X2 [Erythrolamprus reginae]|uniref:ubiquitin carboxyl-terminal hydrolase 4 isoform X2 n=1 Tax=Erythrolamprus reginae TaxID=121349 RepID=UPI00396C529C